MPANRGPHFTHTTDTGACSHSQARDGLGQTSALWYLSSRSKPGYMVCSCPAHLSPLTGQIIKSGFHHFALNLNTKKGHSHEASRSSFVGVSLGIYPFSRPCSTGTGGRWHPEFGLYHPTRKLDSWLCGHFSGISQPVLHREYLGNQWGCDVPRRARGGQHHQRSHPEY